MYNMPPMPNAKDYEAEILSSVFVSDHVLPTAIGIVGPEDFYDTAHAKIYAAMIELFNRNEPVDALTVGDLLKIRGKLDEVGGYPYLARLNGELPVAANMAHYCKAVKNKAVLRKMAVAGWKIAESACMPDADPVEIRAMADAEIMVPEEDKDHALLNAGALADEVLQQAMNERAIRRGLITPWAQFNRLTKGLQPQNLIIVAARPGVGKSSWAINLSECIAASGRPVAFFSLEMSSHEVVRRILAGRTGIPALEILDGGLAEHDKASLKAAFQHIKSWPLSIDDGGGLSVPMIRAKAKKIKAQHGLALVIVDYVQLLKTPKADRRDLEIGLATKELKYLAKELDVPVVALAQINRQAEQQNRRPRLSDLRESGSLEQDTDVVCFLHPEQVFEPGQPRPVTQNILMDVAKHRNGQPDIIEMQFHGPTTTYSERARS